MPHVSDECVSTVDKKRLVVKVGTSTITNDKGEVDVRAIDLICRTIAGIEARGYRVILVSSGAIAVGAGKMRLAQKPEALADKQAAAAVGQCELMHLYDKLFSEYGRLVAQILLSGEDIEDGVRRRNLENTFEALLQAGVIPVVNENDSVSHREIVSDRHLFSDNDTLSAQVAILVGAGKLVILTDTEGLYDKDPCVHGDATLISRVEKIDDAVRALAEGVRSNRGTGGMVTKLEAADLATQKGIDVLVVHGRDPENLYRVIGGDVVGTLFVAQ